MNQLIRFKYADRYVSIRRAGIRSDVFIDGRHRATLHNRQPFKSILYIAQKYASMG